MMMCDIPAEISAEELNRRIAAFYDDFRGIYPTVTLHGVRFRMADEPPANRDTQLSEFSSVQPLPQDDLRNLRIGGIRAVAVTP
jgi:hypothetical protein